MLKVRVNMQFDVEMLRSKRFMMLKLLWMGTKKAKVDTVIVWGRLMSPWPVGRRSV